MTPQHSVTNYNTCKQLHTFHSRDSAHANNPKIAVLQPEACVSICVCVSISTFAHELRHDVYGLLRHDGVKRHQLVMSQFLHDLSLLQKGLWRHGAWLQGLDGHLSGAVPGACIPEMC